MKFLIINKSYKNKLITLIFIIIIFFLVILLSNVLYKDNKQLIKYKSTDKLVFDTFTIVKVYNKDNDSNSVNEIEVIFNNDTIYKDIFYYYYNPFNYQGDVLLINECFIKNNNCYLCFYDNKYEIKDETLIFLNKSYISIGLNGVIFY